MNPAQTGRTLPTGPYETAGGYVMAQLGHLPQVGDIAPADGFTLTVVEIDGRRAARLRVTPEPDPEPERNDAVVNA